MDPSKCITEKVQQLYEKLPACGKPREDEYTVLASVVAETSSGVTVVALASGTKCIGPDCLNEKGCLLSDSHGEVLARRSFVRYLSDWIITVVEQPAATTTEECPLQWNTTSSCQPNLLSIKESWRFSMYISDSPCGDASIYASNLIEENGTNQTGAKLISSPDSASGEKLKSLRTKSGRSDIKIENRTTSMSCSDKVCRWICLGLQGALLSLWMPSVRLVSLIVDQDPSSTPDAQRNALRRALHDRVLAEPELTEETQERSKDCRKVSLSDIPDVFIAPVETCFSRGKAAAKYAHPVSDAAAPTRGTDGAGEETEPVSKKRKKNPLSPCGASVNWYRSSVATVRALATVTTAAAAAMPTTNSSATLSTDVSASHQEAFPLEPAAGGLTNKDTVPRALKPRKVTEVAGGTVEVTIAHTGALQGSVKKCVGEISTASRLSPHAMRALFEHTVQVLQAHRGDSEAHQRLYAHTVDALLNEKSKSIAAIPLLPDLIPQSTSNIDTNTEPLLSMIQQLSRRELKQRCGKCYYNQAKEQFLCHPVFKDWICDE